MKYATEVWYQPPARSASKWEWALGWGGPLSGSDVPRADLDRLSCPKAVAWREGGTEIQTIRAPGLSMVRVHRVKSHSQRGRGNARRLLGRVCAAADELNVKLILTVGPDPGTDPGRLIEFYERFGFVLQSDRFQMLRPPVAPSLPR